MQPSPIACPHCRTALKSKKMLPAGLEILCPSCKKLFQVPAKAPASAPAKAPASAPAKAPASASSTRPPSSAAASQTGKSPAGAAVARGSAPRTATAGPGQPAGVAQPAAAQTTPANMPPPRDGEPSSGVGRFIAMLSGLLLLLVVGAVILFKYGTPGTESKEDPLAEQAKNDPSKQTNPPDNKDNGDPGIRPAPPVTPTKKIGGEKVVKELFKSLNPKEQAEVSDMVKRGVAYLKKTQSDSGHWHQPTFPGHQWNNQIAAMGGLTLLECGVPKTDPSVKRAASFVRSKLDEIQDTYGVSLCLLFLDKLNDPQDEERITQLAARLIVSQNHVGGWGYESPKVIDDRARKMWINYESVKNKNVDQVVNLSRKDAVDQVGFASVVFYGNEPGLRKKFDSATWRSGGDNSNTQFAIIALWAARRRGLPVDPALRLALRRFQLTQNDDGTWSYSSSQQHNDTMTCAGLLGLAIGVGLNDNVSKNQIDKGLDALADAIAKSYNNPRAEAGIYFLWSIERVGVLFRKQKLRGQDWYRWGIGILKPRQHKDGFWNMNSLGYTTTVDTCFALLFLRQANFTEDLSDKLEDFLILGPVVNRKN